MLLSQVGLSTGNCSTGSNTEIHRKKEQPVQSHRSRTPLRLTLCFLSSTAALIQGQKTSCQSHISVLMCHKKTTLTSPPPLKEATATVVLLKSCCPETYPGQPIHLEPCVWLHYSLCSVQPSLHTTEALVSSHNDLPGISLLLQRGTGIDMQLLWVLSPKVPHQRPLLDEHAVQTEVDQVF